MVLLQSLLWFAHLVLKNFDYDVVILSLSVEVSASVLFSTVMLFVPCGLCEILEFF